MTIHVLRTLQEEFCENFVVVLDNAPYFTSMKVKKSGKNTEIELGYLPRYSPQMNPIGEYWRQLNQHLKNRLFDDNVHLNRAIQGAYQGVNPPSVFDFFYL